MAASTGIHAYGSYLSVSEDDVTYTDIAEVVDIDPPAEMVAEAKATHLLSDNAAKEKKPGLSDTDKMVVTINYTAAQMTSLKALRRTNRYWRISLPLESGETTPARLKFYGFWSKLKTGKLDPEDQSVILAQLEISVSGIVTYSEGS